MLVFIGNGQAKSGVSQRHRKELPVFYSGDNAAGVQGNNKLKT